MNFLEVTKKQRTERKIVFVSEMSGSCAYTGKVTLIDTECCLRVTTLTRRKVEVTC